MLNFWNERYKNQEYAYGTQPNLFFKEQLEKLTPGKILLPAEGEGRNAVYAASKGWNVSAFDNSEEGKTKALQLAKSKKLIINYEIYNIEDFITRRNFYDAVALIYVHQPSEVRNSFFPKVIDALKSGGTLMLEGFSKKQLENKTGGPKNIDWLYDEEILRTHFDKMTQVQIAEKTTDLDEGKYHKGTSDIIRLVAKKP